MTDKPMPHHDAEKSNRTLWDEIAPVHLKAYKEVALLRDGAGVLDEIELREIGDVRGKTMLHLQCHFGTDSLAWARRELLDEYDRLFFRRFPSMATDNGRWFRLPDYADKLPLLLTLRAQARVIESAFQ